MFACRENRLRVPRETCVAVDVDSAVGAGRAICEFFFFFCVERTRARWSPARQFAKTEEASEYKNKKTENAEKATQLEKAQPTEAEAETAAAAEKRRRRDLPTDWSGGREPNCQKPWYRSPLANTDTRTHTRANFCTKKSAISLSRNERSLSLSQISHSMSREAEIESVKSIKSAKCLPVRKNVCKKIMS